MKHYETEKAKGKTDEQIMADRAAEIAKDLPEKPQTHGLVVRNPKAKVIKLIEGHFITKEEMRAVVESLLAN